MSAKQVETTCWGKPDRVNHSEKEGIIFDQYVYLNKNRFVYLRNGVVISIEAIAGEVDVIATSPARGFRFRDDRA